MGRRISGELMIRDERDRGLFMLTFLFFAGLRLTTSLGRSLSILIHRSGRASGD